MEASCNLISANLGSMALLGPRIRSVSCLMALGAFVTFCMLASSVMHLLLSLSAMLLLSYSTLSSRSAMVLKCSVFW